MYNDSWTQKSRIYELAHLLLGEEPPRKMNLGDLIGKRCQVIITHNEKDSGDIWERVESVLKAKGRVTTFD
jgi:hypothetical protein